MTLRVLCHGITFLLFTFFGTSKSKVCDPREHLKPYFEGEDMYSECVALNQPKTNPGLGLWVLKECQNNSIFVPIRQACVPVEQLEDEREECKMNPDEDFCDVEVCDISNVNEAKRKCNWLEERLLADKEGGSRAVFHQCMAEQYGHACGRWVKQACPHGTVFEELLQACVSDRVSSNCEANEHGVGFCSPDDQICPGGVICRNGSCCESNIPNLWENSTDERLADHGSRRRYSYSFNMPTCPTTGQKASSTCSNGCPSNTGCYRGGCCPLSSCYTGILATSFCENGCSNGQSCFQGNCCPGRVDEQQYVVQSQGLDCPDGSAPSGPCGGGCANQQSCVQNVGCCPLPTCPTGYPAASFCNSGSCGGQFSCHNGGCCDSIQSAQPAVPTNFQAYQQSGCPSGHPTASSCSQGCEPGNACLQSKCCPLPACPSGQPAQGFCDNGCPRDTECNQGTCCPQQVEVSLLTSYVYQNSVPECPDNSRPVGQCNIGCPTGTQCYQSSGQCCQLPRCQNGQPANSFCQSQCNNGNTCNNGGCCPSSEQSETSMIQITITCPSGAASKVPCSNGCPQETMCHQGTCCEVSRCPSGQVATGFCNQGCPQDNSCVQGTCCGQQQPRPLSQFITTTCPSGQPASNPCVDGCSQKESCYEGVCCPIPQCPSSQQPVGYCSNGCPSQSSCVQGTCCLQLGGQQQIVRPQVQTVCPGGQISHNPCSSGCASGTACYQGSCCSIPTCSSGQPSTGFCNSDNQCGSQESCSQGACCGQPKCPGGSQSFGSCSQGCGRNAGCYQGSCCPLPVCPTGNIATSFCSSGCNPGTECQQGGCCMQPQNMAVPSPIQKVASGYGVSIEISCPNGLQAQGSCSNGCPANSGCYKGSCCPLSTCSNGQSAKNFCQQSQSCGTQHSCYQGGCCEKPSSQYVVPPIVTVRVTCPSGRVATQSCDQGCRQGASCYQGACCPMPSCPGGGQGSGFCSTSSSCGQYQICFQGTCCQQQQAKCPTGTASSQRCSIGCPSGSSCYNGYCCPLPTCPGGSYGTSFCGKGNNCGIYESCYQGICCRKLPEVRCPSGQVSNTLCGGGCQRGSGCYQGACCPFTSCPNGGQGNRFCGVGAAGCSRGEICYRGSCCQNTQVQCPTGQVSTTSCDQGCNQGASCYQGACCPLQRCQDGKPPVGFCGSSYNQCPQGASCEGGQCCQKLTIPCPYGGIVSQTSCSEGCGSNAGCFQGACCPLPTCQSGQIAITFCLQTNNYGGNCPGQSTCDNGGCCPQIVEPVVPVKPSYILPPINPTPIIEPVRPVQPIYTGGAVIEPVQPVQPIARRITCPNGQMSNTPCGSYCQNIPTAACYSGRCCPLSPCPSGATAQGFCGTSACRGGSTCVQGTCCSRPSKPNTCCNGGSSMILTVKIICPSGVRTTQSCGGSGYLSGSECGTGSSCYNGGCCPLPVCPSGGQANGVCGGSNNCNSNERCYQGGCCNVGTATVQPRQTCPTGVQATGVCSSGCPQNTVCHRGGCCPLPPCPGGSRASSLCSPGCPTGTGCYRGGCCPSSLPRPGGYNTNAGGQISVTIQITCPSGHTSRQPCSSGCEQTQQCYQGACCPQPTCSNGQYASQPCQQQGYGGQTRCPPGSTCQQGGCCPTTTNLCPQGVPPVQPYGGNCPTGYSQMTEGCCPGSSSSSWYQSQTATCPTGQTAQCQCSENRCPSGTQCNSGSCCGGQGSQTTPPPIPGGQCAGQCPPHATCNQGYCECDQGYSSNGVRCVQPVAQLMQYQPRPACSMCQSNDRRFKDHAPKKLPEDQIIFPPLANITRRCSSNCTCTPAEVCHEGRCLLRMVPGQTGCKADIQCSYDCTTSRCSNGTCTCDGGFVFPEFGLCYKSCPVGTTVENKRCRLQETLESLTQNRTKRKQLERKHTCGKVTKRRCSKS